MSECRTLCLRAGLMSECRTVSEGRTLWLSEGSTLCLRAGLCV